MAPPTARAGNRTRRQMLRRGRDLRGPLSSAPVPGRVSRHDAFTQRAHEVTERVTTRAGLEESDWALTVVVAPGAEVSAADRWGRIESTDGTWHLVLHRLAFASTRQTQDETDALVEAVVADLLAEALGLDPDTLADD